MLLIVYRQRSFYVLKSSMRNNYLQGEFYHVLNRSIAHFGIFKDLDNCQRFLEELDYYNNNNVVEKYSIALQKKKYQYQNILVPKSNCLVKFISYKIMPDHYHLLVKILKDNKLSKYIANIENSFSRFFNIKFKRKGPLWESRFKAVKIKTNEQLLHTTRYIHLNATTANLVDQPDDWKYSSYRDFIIDNFLKKYLSEISIVNADLYKKFVENRKDYQKKLGLIKKLMLD